MPQATDLLHTSESVRSRNRSRSHWHSTMPNPTSSTTSSPTENQVRNELREISEEAQGRPHHAPLAQLITRAPRTQRCLMSFLGPGCTAQYTFAVVPVLLCSQFAGQLPVKHIGAQAAPTVLARGNVRCDAAAHPSPTSGPVRAPAIGCCARRAALHSAAAEEHNPGRPPSID
jgi:hypothetical protein